MFPLYFAALKPAGAWEILAHRIAWTLLFCVLVIAVRRDVGWLRPLLARRRMLAGITVAALLIAVNWLVYVAAVTAGHVTDASLGYFLNPLVTVALGVVVLRETLRPMQALAVLIGAVGAAYLSLTGGSMPAITLRRVTSGPAAQSPWQPTQPTWQCACWQRRATAMPPISASRLRRSWCAWCSRCTPVRRGDPVNKSNIAKTNAVRVLDGLGIAYTLDPYEVDESDLSAETVARKVALAITDAARVAAEKGGPLGWYDVSTLKEPYRVEGKKTMGYELAEQLGWTLPDVVIYPTGGGTGLIGMWKAWEEMERLGWVGPARPRMVVVQAEGCAPIPRAFDAGAPVSIRFPDAHTYASGLRVPKAYADYLILKILRESKGEAVTVTDDEMRRGVLEMAASEGLFAAPEGGAAWIAVEKLLAAGKLDRGERVVVVAWFPKAFTGG